MFRVKVIISLTLDYVYEMFFLFTITGNANDQYVQLFIHSPMGKIVVCRCQNDKHLVVTIKQHVFAATGIPKEVQNVYYGHKRLTDTETLPTHEEMEYNIDVRLKVKGGTLECDICFGEGEFICTECNRQVTCKICCDRLHQHPKRAQHEPSALRSNSVSDNCSIASPEKSEQLLDHPMSDGAVRCYDMECDSLETDSLFMEASMIMTLAERFNITKFKAYQKEVISAVMSGRDCCVIHPTGSGKSLCYQFPAVFEDKKTIVVTPTISLMQDQVTNCEENSIPAVFLGSAQFDVSAEDRALSVAGKENLKYVTPEWMAKQSSKDKLQNLAKENRISMIAIDEAHLYHQWQEFRPAYKALENLKIDFPEVPLMCLTATAPPIIKESMCHLLRHPLISIASIDRPNIYLSCEEMPGVGKFDYFASRVCDILTDSECSIIYTDFIDSVGPIMSELNKYGLDSVAYYGEMDAKSRNESYHKWRNGEVNIMVATSAFGMGVNKSNIRNIIRYGVPENVCAWAQELGRAGRDGKPSKATIFYTMSDIEHAGAWIKGRINTIHSDQVLKGFSQSWKYVLSHLAFKCRREMLLTLFEDQHNGVVEKKDCCNVCRNMLQKETIQVDCTEELKVLYDAIDVLGVRGEVKLAQWIRGSSLAWTNSFNKLTMSYSNFMGHSETWWRMFMRQCHILGFIDKELRSIIMQNKHHSIQGIICATQAGKELIENGEQLMVLQSLSVDEKCQSGSHATQTSRSKGIQSKGIQSKGDRHGKGTHSIIAVRKLMEDKENWCEITDKRQYQFPGCFFTSQMQVVYYTPNSRELLRHVFTIFIICGMIYNFLKGAGTKTGILSSTLTVKKNTFCIALLLVMA